MYITQYLMLYVYIYIYIYIGRAQVRAYDDRAQC